MSVELDFKVNFKRKDFSFNKELTTLGTKIKSSFLQEYASGIKSGRLYGKHRASGPGETPARITGKLGESLLTRVASNSLQIVDKSGYGAYLEFGTTKIAKREGVKQAFNKNEENFINDLSRHFK